MVGTDTAAVRCAGPDCARPGAVLCAGCRRAVCARHACPAGAPEDGLLCAACAAAGLAGARGRRPLPGLRAARRRAALTQEQLAERAAVGVSTVAHLEAGARPAATPTVQKVAAALGVEPAELSRPSGGSPEDRTPSPSPGAAYR